MVTVLLSGQSRDLLHFNYWRLTFPYAFRGPDLIDDDIAVGINADVTGDSYRFPGNLPGRKLSVAPECPSGSQRVRPSRSDGENPVVGLDNITGSRQEIDGFPIRCQEESFQMA